MQFRELGSESGVKGKGREMKLKTFTTVQALAQGCLMLAVAAAVAAAVIFPNFKVAGSVPPLVCAVYIMFLAFWAGIIAAIGGINAGRNDWLSGKLKLSPLEQEKLKQVSAPVAPLFLVPSVYAVIQLLAVDAITLLISYKLFPQGMAMATLVMVSALLIGLHSALLTKLMTGRELLKYIAHPLAAPISFKLNLAREHFSGNAFANLMINGAFGYAMYHASALHPEGVVALKDLAIDILLMNTGVAVLVPIGTTLQAANESLEKRAAPRVRDSAWHPGLLVRVICYVALAASCSVVCILVLYGLGMKELSLTPVMLIKGLLSAAVAVLVAGLAAYWSASKAAADPGGRRET